MLRRCWAQVASPPYFGQRFVAAAAVYAATTAAAGQHPRQDLRVVDAGLGWVFSAKVRI